MLMLLEQRIVSFGEKRLLEIESGALATEVMEFHGGIRSDRRCDVNRTEVYTMKRRQDQLIEIRDEN